MADFLAIFNLYNECCKEDNVSLKVLEQLPGDGGGDDEYCASNHGRELGPACGVH